MPRGHIRVSRNFTMKVDRCVSPRTCRAIGLGLLVKIENRTIGGRDETGKGFKEYSKSYGPHVKGRLRPVDLKRSGDMLGDMDVLKADGQRIQLGFRSDAMWQRAKYHDAGGPADHPKMPYRPFLGISTAWVDDIARQIRLGLFKP